MIKCILRRQTNGQAMETSIRGACGFCMTFWKSRCCQYRGWLEYTTSSRAMKLRRGSGDCRSLDIAPSLIFALNQIIYCNHQHMSVRVGAPRQAHSHIWIPLERQILWLRACYPAVQLIRSSGSVDGIERKCVEPLVQQETCQE